MRCQFNWGPSFYITLQTDNSEIQFYTYTCNNLLKYKYVCLVRNTHLKVAENLNSKRRFTGKDRQKITIKFLLMSPRFKSRTNSNILKRDFRMYGQERIKIERKLFWLARPLHRIMWPKYTQTWTVLTQKLRQNFLKQKRQNVEYAYTCTLAFLCIMKMLLLKFSSNLESLFQIQLLSYILNLICIIALWLHPSSI